MSKDQAKIAIEKLVNRYAEQQKSYHSADYNEILAQVKRGHIAQLPKVVPTKNQAAIQSEIVKHVEALLKLNKELKENKVPTKVEQAKQRIEHAEEKINQLVYELYELTPEEIAIIENSVNN